MNCDDLFGVALKLHSPVKCELYRKYRQQIRSTNFKLNHIT